MITKHYKAKQLTWSYRVFCDGQLWTCEEWVCNEYPDLFSRTHRNKSTGTQFSQFMLKGDHGTRHASLKAAFKALMKRPARRIRNVKKNKPRRITAKHRKARR